MSKIRFGIARFFSPVRVALLVVVLSACMERARSQVVAYEVTPGVVGAEPLGSGLIIGLDFTVNSPVQVTKLGAFDSGSDGVFLNNVEVALFNRDTGQAVTSIVTFSTASNGTADGGSRFKDLATAVTLPIGFHGSIVAGPYAGPSGEPNGNVVHQTQQWSFNGGGGLLTQNHGRYDFGYTFGGGLFLPTGFDTTGLADPTFAAGTFVYTAVPEPSRISLATGFALACFCLFLHRRRSGWWSHAGDCRRLFTKHLLP